MDMKEIRVLEEGVYPLIQPLDIEEFRRHNRSKPKELVDKLMDEKTAVSNFIRPGVYVGIDLYGTVRCPMSILREIVRQRITGLKVLGRGVLDLDLLSAAGVFDEADITYIGLEVYGTSKNFRRLVESGRLKRLVEWSNAAIAWRIKAAAMGIPFIPVRSMLGTDTFKYSSAKVIQCPFTGKPVCLLPALIPDVGIIHVHRADRYGNAQIDGISGFAGELARASKYVIISAEEIIDTKEIKRRPDMTIIPYYLVDAVVHAPFGSHPGEMAGMYERDEEHIKSYYKDTEDEGKVAAYLDKWIYGVKNHEEYLDLVGRKRLEDLKIKESS